MILLNSMHNLIHKKTILFILSIINEHYTDLQRSTQFFILFLILINMAQGLKAQKVQVADIEISYDSSYSSDVDLEALMQVFAEKSTKAQLVHPSTQVDCRIAQEKKDEISGLITQSLYPRALFSYTPEAFQKFFKGEHFMESTAYLNKTSANVYFLSVEIIVRSKSAPKLLGSIPKYSTLTLRSMDQQSFELKNMVDTRPVIQSENSIYQCVYLIEKSDLNKLKKIELDKVKVEFSKSSQLFEIFEFDFFKAQFECLE